MLKAFTPVAVLVFSFFSGLEKTSAVELYIVTIICVGVALTSVGETYFSWTGFTFQSLAILGTYLCSTCDARGRRVHCCLLRTSCGMLPKSQLLCLTLTPHPSPLTCVLLVLLHCS